MSIQKRFVSTKTAGNGTAARDPLTYTESGWFPVNSTHFKELKDRINSHQFDNDREGLIREVRADVSLLGYLFKGLSGYAARDGKGKHPMQILRDVPHEELVRILSCSEGSITSHSFSDMVSLQALRLKHSVISSSTAELMAAKCGVDPDLVYSCAVVRQLGLNLMAWNYPRIYSKAMASVAQGESNDLDTLLLKATGISPRILGVKVGLPWNLSDEMRQALGEEGAQLAGRSPTGLAAARFCEIGETLARINDPEHYPAASKEWEDVVKDIQQFLGPSGVNLIRDRIAERCSLYTGVAPRLFEGDISPEKNAQRANQHYAKVLFDSNSFVLRCPEGMQELFRKVYARVVPGQVSVEAIQILIAELIPATGFLRGVVYLADPSNENLVPMLRIGDGSLSRYRTFSALTSAKGDNPIVDALYSGIPIKQEDVFLHGERVSHISGSIGNGERPGVLYLEMGPSLLNSSGNEALTYFRALSRCVNDCLNLGTREALVHR